jgi:hypothetical protein
MATYGKSRCFQFFAYAYWFVLSLTVTMMTVSFGRLGTRQNTMKKAIPYGGAPSTKSWRQS